MHRRSGQNATAGAHNPGGDRQADQNHVCWWTAALHPVHRMTSRSAKRCGFQILGSPFGWSAVRQRLEDRARSPRSQLFLVPHECGSFISVGLPFTLFLPSNADANTKCFAACAICFHILLMYNDLEDQRRKLTT